MPNSKDLNWEPTSPGPFEVQYRVKGVGEWLNYPSNPISSPPIQIPNLNSSTTYEWRVRKDCGGGEFSGWVQGPDIIMPITCSPPLQLVVSVEKDETLGSRVTLSWFRTLVTLDPDVNVKIFYKLKDAAAYTEWTSGTLPTFNGRIWISPWSTVPGVYEWYLEMQCASGDRPRRNGPEFTFEPGPCPVIPPSIVYNSTLNQFEWTDPPGVNTFEYQILEKEPISGSAFNLLVEKGTTDPNTGNWNSEPVTVDFEDFVITDLGLGCTNPERPGDPPGNNNAWKAEYKPGGTLSPVPKGIKLILQTYEHDPPIVVDVLKRESYELIATGEQSTFVWCLPPNDRVFVTPTVRRIRVIPTTVGLVAGNTYRLRVRSICAYNTSPWVEFDYTVPPSNSTIINLSASIPPQNYLFTKRVRMGNNWVDGSFRIDRPPNPPTNESVWTNHKLGNFPPGSPFIPLTDYVVSNPGKGTLTIKTNGDILLSVSFLGTEPQAIYYSFSYRVP